MFKLLIKVTTFVVICFALWQSSARCQPTHAVYRIILDGKATAAISATTLNGRDYVPFSVIATKVFGATHNVNANFEFQVGDNSVRCAPYSFVVIRENAEGIRSAQIPYPTLDFDSELYVPIWPFFRALDALGLYGATIETSRIMLRSGKTSLEQVMITPGAPMAATAQSQDSDEPVTGPTRSQLRDVAPQLRRLSSAVESAMDYVAEVGTVSADGDLIEFGREDDGEEIGTFQSEYYGVTPFSDSAPTSAPNVYILPEDLKRRPLEQETKPRQLPLRPFPQPITPDTAVRSRQRYTLPPDLKRRNSADSGRSYYKSDRVFDPLGSPLLASLLPLEYLEARAEDADAAPSPETTADARINEIDVRATASYVELTFSASRTIPGYQRPEYSSKNLTLRLTDCVNGVSDLKDIARNNASISAISTEKIRNILVYRLRLPSTITDCDYRRLGPRKLRIKIYTNGPAADPADIAENEAKKWELDVIVLDPGHGGKDVGAIGVDGHREKDVALQLAKKLGALIRKHMPETKVVYTRKDDRFVELYRRGKIANEAGGKLFISIHANSTPTKPHPATGFETFILRPGKNKDAIEVADRENASIRFEKDQSHYKRLTEEQFIVVNMAQSAFVKFSELFAGQVNKHVGATTNLTNRGVKQAGFYVLVGASMPNILFEAGFLSNRSDQNYIVSEKGQNAIAKGILRAIKDYAKAYKEALMSQR